MEVLRELMNHGTSVNFVNKDGYILSIQQAKKATWRLSELLNHDPNVDFTVNKGYIPLFIEAQNSHVEVV